MSYKNYKGKRFSKGSYTPYKSYKKKGVFKKRSMYKKKGFGRKNLKNSWLVKKYPNHGKVDLPVEIGGVGEALRFNLSGSSDRYKDQYIWNITEMLSRTEYFKKSEIGLTGNGGF